MKKNNLIFKIIIVLLINNCILIAQEKNLSASIINDVVIFEEKDGLVAIEAENFYQQTLTDKRKWYRTSKNELAKVGRDDDTEHSQGASNKSYLEILPDTRVTHDDQLMRGENFTNKAGEVAILHYRVKFNTPGRYYVWVRAFSTGSEDNGLHVGLNDIWPESGKRMQWCEGRGQWTWASKQRTKEEHCGIPHEIYLDIDKAGVNNIQFSMREDGFEFDKFILTKDINYVPIEKGPKQLLAQGHLPEPLAKGNTPAGRIAIVADGNSPDPDDLGGTAVSIALLKASGLEDRLVHYSHSCDLVRGKRISEKAEKERHHLMQVSCDVTARRWGGFENLTFLDALWQKKETIKDLCKAINASTAENPLWIIEAGEPDIIGFALDASKKKKHKFVKVVTHHPANDNAGDFYEWQQILDFGVEEVRIPDQNINLKVDLKQWDWAKNHADSRIQWIWTIGKIAEVDDVVKFQKGKWDCSDAGMILYWITGANVNNGLKQGTVEDVKAILVDYIERNP